MASASVGSAEGPLAGRQLLACVAEHGSGAHPWPQGEALSRGEEVSRNLADLIHFLCVLYGRYPGVIDHAAARIVEPRARAWIAEASYAFAGERALLARLAVAAGPVPSTPGAGDSDAAVIGQRHAIEMLANSERNGCALGAAMAVVLDWSYVRGALDAAARRFGVESPPFSAGEAETVAAVADAYADTAPVQRALLFGAQQILLQHRGLWDLLEARAAARSATL
jgi:hypothetical protein